MYTIEELKAGKTSITRDDMKELLIAVLDYVNRKEYSPEEKEFQIETNQDFNLAMEIQEWFNLERTRR